MKKKFTTTQDGYINVIADGGAISGTFNMTIKQLAQRHQIASNDIKIDEKLPTEETLEINGKPLKVTTDMTYKDLINKINDGDYGVSAYTLGGKVFMSAKKEGMGGEIKFTSEKSDLFQKNGLIYSGW